MLGSSCRASRGGKRGAGSLTLQSVGVLRGTGAAWKRGSLGRERGAILAITQSARRWNAPRSLSERITLRGAVRAQRPTRWSAPRSRGANHQVRATRARGSASRGIVRATNEVCGTGSRRGLARRNVGANLHSSRPGPRRARFFGGMRCAARQPASVPARGRTKAKARRGSSPPRAERGCEAARGECPCIARFAEVGRTPSGSEKRVTGVERVESPIGTRSAWTGA
jgi:hypothetical protein